MPRRPRIKLAGLPQNIVQRAINREPCFFADGISPLLASGRKAPARIFKNGNSRAVHTPAELAYSSWDIEWVIDRQGGELRIRPAQRRLGDVLGKLAKFSPDFMAQGRGENIEGEREALCNRSTTFPAWSLKTGSTSTDRPHKTRGARLKIAHRRYLVVGVRVRLDGDRQPAAGERPAPAHTELCRSDKGNDVRRSDRAAPRRVAIGAWSRCRLLLFHPRWNRIQRLTDVQYNRRRSAGTQPVPLVRACVVVMARR